LFLIIACRHQDYDLLSRNPSDGRTLFHDTITHVWLLKLVNGERATLAGPLQLVLNRFPHLCTVDTTYMIHIVNNIHMGLY
jgi:hypothetical protein